MNSYLENSSGIFRRSRRIPLPEPASITSRSSKDAAGSSASKSTAPRNRRTAYRQLGIKPSSWKSMLSLFNVSKAWRLYVFFPENLERRLFSYALSGDWVRPDRYRMNSCYGYCQAPGLQSSVKSVQSVVYLLFSVFRFGTGDNRRTRT